MTQTAARASAHPWFHRIDAVPDIGSEVEVTGPHKVVVIRATVIAAPPAFFAEFQGVGAEVAYQLQGWPEPTRADAISYWRPAAGADLRFYEGEE